MTELLDQRAQDGKRGGLLAALFFSEQLWQRRQSPEQRGALRTEGFPMRIAREHRQQHLVQHLASLIEWAKLYLAIDGDDLERRSRGCEIPARVSSGEFRSGGKRYAAM